MLTESGLDSEWYIFLTGEQIRQVSLVSPGIFIWKLIHRGLKWEGKGIFVIYS
jgi:hypothetical protein